MIPSRGLRWSSQAISLGRRRAELFSARQFSSVQNASINSRPVLPNKGTSILQSNARFQFSKPNTLLRNGTGTRFASTAPSTSAIATTPESISAASSPAASTLQVTTTSLDNALDSDSLYNIPEHIGYLKSMGLEFGFGPTSGMEWILEHVHVYAGTPWWVSIALTAVLVRAVLFKAYISAADNASRMQSIQRITQPISKKMMASLKEGDQVTGMQLRQELKMINKRAGIKVWRSFVPAFQMFAGYGTFVLLRQMALLPVPGFETGGILWFQNLALPDPFLILPISTSAILYYVMRRGGEVGASSLTPEMQKVFMYGLPALSLLFTWWLPAATQISFFVSGLLSFGQASLFRIPYFRTLFGIHSNAPIPASGPDSRPAPVYKGEMKIRAPLTQADVDAAYEKGRKESLLQKATRGVYDATSEVRTAGGTLMGKARERYNSGNEKREKEARDKYEERRSREIAEEKRNRAQHERDVRMAKRMAKQKQ